jgi:hypothetical protein
VSTDRMINEGKDMEGNGRRLILMLCSGISLE